MSATHLTQLRNAERALKTIHLVLQDAEQNPVVSQVMALIADGIARTPCDTSQNIHAERLAYIVDQGMQTMKNIVAELEGVEEE